MAIVNVTIPNETIVTLSDVKAHLRVDFTDDDALIQSLIGVAVEWVENQVQRRLAVRQVNWITDNLVSGMRLPLAPVVSVDAINYLAFPYGPATLLASSQYIVAQDGQATIINKPYNLIWPWIGQGSQPVVVTFTVGGAALVSASIIHVIKMLVANFYEFRQSTTLTGSQPALLNLTGGQLNVIDSLLYADRWE